MTECSVRVSERHDVASFADIVDGTFVNVPCPWCMCENVVVLKHTSAFMFCRACNRAICVCQFGEA